MADNTVINIVHGEHEVIDIEFQTGSLHDEVCVCITVCMCVGVCVSLYVRTTYVCVYTSMHACTYTCYCWLSKSSPCLHILYSVTS